MAQTLQSLHVDTRPSEEVKALLYQNVIGTPGSSMVYQHGKTAEKLEHVADPYFVSLVRKERVLAVCCFCRRYAADYTLYYARYFTFREDLRKSGNKKLTNVERESSLRKDIHHLLTGKNFESGGDNVVYAYLDPENQRSRRLTEEFGFRKVAEFASLVFSRWRLQKIPGVEKLETAEWSRFKDELASFYGHHQFFTFENLYYKGNYFVVREDERIVAGLQANPESWQVYGMPGFGGKILMRIFPRFGFLRKVFDPNYRFVSVEGIYYVKGHEHQLEKLLKHVLAHFGVHSAVICPDVKSAEYQVIKQLDLGMISRLRKEKLMDIIVKENGGSPIREDRPAYVSCFDVT